MTLPANCGACTMHIAMLCRRHAPSPSLGMGTQGQKVAWPETRDTDRCGDGSTDTPPVHCEHCVHWFQADGKPLDPPSGGGSGFWAVQADEKREWWAHSGYCTRHAPSPALGELRAAYWKVTNGKLDGCGDGEELEPDGDEDEEG
jgi:hypothetical protein